MTGITKLIHKFLSLSKDIAILLKKAFTIVFSLLTATSHPCYH